MTRNEIEIFEALARHLGTLTDGLPVSQTAYPNKPLNPGKDPSGRVRPYQSVSFLPSPISSQAIGYESETRTGIFQVSVYWPSDTGISPVTEAAARVAEHYAPGLVLTEDGVVVRIDEYPHIAGMIQEPDRVQVPVSVRWTSLAT